MSEELRHKQRLLIPVNIIVSILCLVAIISLIFTPLLTLNVDKLITEGEVKKYAADAVSSIIDDKDVVDELVDTITEDFDGVKINISIYGLTKIAFAKDVIDEAVNSVVDFAVDIVKRVQRDLIGIVAVTYLPTLIDSIDGLDIDVDNIDFDEILDKFDNIFKAKGDEAVNAAIGSLIDEIQSQTGAEEIGTYKEDIQELIKDYYDIAKEALGDKEMTLESFISVLFSKLKNMSEEDSSTTVHTIAYTASAEGEGESSNSEDVIYVNYSELMHSLVDSLLGDIKDSAKSYLQIVKYAVMALYLFPLVWFVQFLFAFIRIFTKNKRFLMWYTKILGFIPCLIFGIAPIIATKFLASMLPEILITILGILSSMTWISGGCYIALWLISICWAFPIKRKIRKLLKDGATYD